MHIYIYKATYLYISVWAHISFGPTLIRQREKERDRERERDRQREGEREGGRVAYAPWGA
jgi:hypothetical protein